MQKSSNWSKRGPITAFIVGNATFSLNCCWQVGQTRSQKPVYSRFIIIGLILGSIHNKNGGLCGEEGLT